jgi:hypothetical protein
VKAARSVIFDWCRLLRGCTDASGLITLIITKLRCFVAVTRNYATPWHLANGALLSLVFCPMVTRCTHGGFGGRAFRCVPISPMGRRLVPLSQRLWLGVVYASCNKCSYPHKRLPMKFYLDCLVPAGNVVQNVYLRSRWRALGWTKSW